MGFGTPVSDKPMFVEGCETPAYYVPVNEFVADFVDKNVSAVPFLEDGNRKETGTLESADLKDHEAALQIRMLADNCSNILRLAEDDSVRLQACDSVIETVIRLQNPKYATDQIQVRNEAHKMQISFEEDKFRQFKNGKSAEEVHAIPDPSEAMLEEFETYVNETYNVEGMRERAIFTLIPKLDRSVIRDFVEVTGVVPELETSFAKTARRIGSFVSSRFVQLKIA